VTCQLKAFVISIFAVRSHCDLVAARPDGTVGFGILGQDILVRHLNSLFIKENPPS